MEIFQLTNTDRRQEFLNAAESGEKFEGQVLGGGKVSDFTPENGFVLLRKTRKYDMLKLTGDKAVKLGIQRAVAIARLSMGPRLELREFYYTLRGQPDLVEPFAKVSNIYSTVLESIKDTETLCDIDRSHFTVGNFPKGFINYAHSPTYGNMEKPIGFTENIARAVLNEYEVVNAMNIVHLEKMAAATRLVDMRFGELTNSIITTTGGNFTRAVYNLTKRFHDSKNMLFFCDGDAYGNDMLRALEYGTMASRHLTPDQAFPESVHPNIHIAGLFPSVAERLGIPNDVEQKRPMSNPHVKQRIEFMKRYNVVNEADVKTWERNQTFELEALSTFFKGNNGKPVGLGIYLVETMRLKGIPCKPQPEKDDEDLIGEFKEEVESSLNNKVRPSVETDFIREIVEVLKEPIQEWVRNTKEEIVAARLEEVLDHAENQDAEIVRNKLLKQYEMTPTREVFDMKRVADAVFGDVKVTAETPGIEKIAEKVRNLLEELKEELKEIMENWTYEETIELKELRNPGEPRDFYDVVEEEIGADPEDCEKVREALAVRLNA